MFIWFNDRCVGNCKFCSNGASVNKKRFEYTEKEMCDITQYTMKQKHYSEFCIFGGEAILEIDNIYKWFDIWYHARSNNRTIDWVTGLHLFDKKIEFIKTILQKYPDSKIVLAVSFDGKPEYDLLSNRYPNNDLIFEECIKKLRMETKDYWNRLYISTKKVITPYEIQNDIFIDNIEYTKSKIYPLLNKDMLQMYNYVVAYPAYIWNKQNIDKFINIVQKYNIYLPMSNLVNKKTSKYVQTIMVNKILDKPNMYYDLHMMDTVPILNKLEKDMYNIYIKKTNMLYATCLNCEMKHLCCSTTRPYIDNIRNTYTMCYIMTGLARELKIVPKNLSLLYYLYYKESPYYDRCLSIIDDNIEVQDPLTNIVKKYRKNEKQKVFNMILNIKQIDSIEDECLLDQMLWWSDEKAYMDKSLDMKYLYNMTNKWGTYYKPHSFLASSIS